MDVCNHYLPCCPLNLQLCVSEWLISFWILLEKVFSISISSGQWLRLSFCFFFNLSIKLFTLQLFIVLVYLVARSPMSPAVLHESWLYSPEDLCGAVISRIFISLTYQAESYYWSCVNIIKLAVRVVKESTRISSFVDIII